MHQLHAPDMHDLDRGGGAVGVLGPANQSHFNGINATQSLWGL